MNKVFINKIFTLLAYTTQILDDALVYHAHSSQHGELNLDDVKLAITTREQHQYSEIPSVDNLVNLARTRNKFSIAIEKNEVLLPPLRLCVGARNYRIAVNTAKRQRILPPQTYAYEEAKKSISPASNGTETSQGPSDTMSDQ